MEGKTFYWRVVVARSAAERNMQRGWYEERVGEDRRNKGKQGKEGVGNGGHGESKEGHALGVERARGI